MKHKRLYPRNDYTNIYEIEYKKLLDLGIKGIIFDIDNTLVAYDRQHPTDENHELFKQLHEMGFKVCLISNNTKMRVDVYTKELDMLAIPNGLKPFRKNFIKAIELLDLKPEKVAMVGDQIFTDVLGGNRVGLYTILVTPIQKKEQWITAIKRDIEGLVYKSYLKSKGK